LGRELIFGDPEIFRLTKENFVPVTGDDWYQRRREDAEGIFFRRLADQGPRKGENDSTRQGIYCFTAGGKLLAYRNGYDPKLMRETLKKALAEWKKLPASETRPGALPIEPLGKVDPRYQRRPPSGGLILDVHTRILDRDAKGEFHRGACQSAGGERSARDHMWLTKEDCQALVPAGLKTGDRFPLPGRVADRLVRFHLVDNTRGEPPMWQRDEVRDSEITLTVEEASTAAVRLRLDGSVILATNKDIDRSDRGFIVRLLGYLNYDDGKNTIDRFEVVAIGEHWGETALTKSARPGRSLLGIAAELAHGDSPANQVPPQGARTIEEYLGKPNRDQK
jgi:hypothetical protein